MFALSNINKMCKVVSAFSKQILFVFETYGKTKPATANEWANECCVFRAFVRLFWDSQELVDEAKWEKMCAERPLNAIRRDVRSECRYLPKLLEPKTPV